MPKKILFINTSHYWTCGACKMDILVIDNKKLYDMRIRLHTKTCKGRIGQDIKSDGRYGKAMVDDGDGFNMEAKGKFKNKMI